MVGLKSMFFLLNDMVLLVYALIVLVVFMMYVAKLCFVTQPKKLIVCIFIEQNLPKFSMFLKSNDEMLRMYFFPLKFMATA